MDEETGREEELSEEQLQAINGGCGQCLNDLNQADRHQEYAKTYTRLFEAAKNSSAHSDSKRYHNLAQEEAQKAQIFLDRVARRHSRPR